MHCKNEDLGVGTSFCSHLLCSYRRTLTKCQPNINEGCNYYVQNEYPSPLKENHTCLDYKKQKRYNDSSTVKLIEDREYEEEVIGDWQSRYFNTFHYINGSEPGQEFLLCAMYKNGITRLKVLLLRVLGIEGKNINEVDFPTIKLLEPSERRELLNNPNIPRIKIVRNPYIRAVSMYKDKVATLPKNPKGFYQGHELRFNHFPSFEDFIKQIYRQQQQHKFVNYHFAPQYQHCWEHEGLTYDYVLKVERMNYWYPCFIENFNLWRFVMNGWPEEDDCYLSTSDVPCHGPAQDEEGGLYYPDKRWENKAGVSSRHHKHASKDYREYYKNETIARLVTELYLNDIAQYHYPYWKEIM
eukprot:TRINITY_DN20602_c0_g1_i3.p1 TRINITY_DN20602_c0_g1~~TRINITY_DN20602_c0_g1_i3.p1  ORF type:complete len:355 (-),score=22.01 TRINITY_DN20602_c0_g1_i3:490-1554(-)